MNNTDHPVAPEQIMAWLDGETDHEQSRAIAGHLAECGDCSVIAEAFKELSGTLSRWVLDEPGREIDAAVAKALTEHEPAGHRKRPAKASPILSSRKRWAGVAAGLAAAVFLIVGVVQLGDRQLMPDRNPASVRQQKEYLQPALNLDLLGGVISGNHANLTPVPAMQAEARSGVENGPPNAGGYPQTATQGPMIARTASLSLQVTDFSTARNALDSILARHNGYSASLTVDTPQNGARHFQASLRIPASDIEPTLRDLKSLGRTLNESQSGDEVTKEHADLAARLQNSHETEARLRTILRQSTGKIKDILEVEEEIARVREGIESMESDQRALEHRITFAGVDIQFVEEYKEQFDASSISTTSRLSNALVEGLRNAAGTLLGLVLLIEEYGPTTLIWCAILGLPGYLIWRRYRKVNAMF